MKHFLRTHAVDKPRCLFSSVADQTELTTNSSISMITNRLINAGYSEWNRMCWNWAPRWAIPTMKLWAEQDTCSPFSVFKEHQGEKGSDGGRVCLFCKTATYLIHCVWYCSLALTQGLLGWVLQPSLNLVSEKHLLLLVSYLNSFSQAIKFHISFSCWFFPELLETQLNLHSIILLTLAFISPLPPSG